MLAGFALIYPNSFKKRVMLIILGIAFMAACWFIALPVLADHIVERLSISSVIETGGTGRWGIWMHMLEEIADAPERLFFGRGFHSKYEINLQGGGGVAVAHNQVIQILFDQGVAGLLVFLLLTLGCFLRCIKKRKVVSIAIIGMMALSISLSFNQTTRTFWNLIAYAAFSFPECKKIMDTKNPTLPEEDRT